jgi:hypothetical protein
MIRDAGDACDTRVRLRLLFIPVSAPRGTGEYARSLAIASAVAQRRPDVAIHFIVSREATYAGNVPFPVTRLPSSPTFHTAEVTTVIRSFEPDVVVFDNAGRTGQLRVARAAGARIVFVSSRPRPRRRAFRMKWMRLIDEHWIASPEIVAGGLGAFERLKLRMLGRPLVRFIDTLLPAASDEATRQLLSKTGVQADRFVLLVPGGGSAHPRMRGAPLAFREAAARIAAQGHDVVLVGAPRNESDARSPDLLRVLPPLPMADLVALMRQARMVVGNGADTLLQAMACGKACVAVPMAPDQVDRLHRLAAAGFDVAAPIEAVAIERRVLELLHDENARRTLAEKARSLNIRDAMGTVVDAVTALAQRRNAA